MSVALTVVGGYLGSGKTTLINQSLMRARPAHTRQLAVLVNDFGSVNIDEHLIRSRSPDGRVLGLTNGCICCSVQDDLGAALEQMLALPVDHVVIEASGVASPAKVLSYGRDWPGYTARGSVVTVNAATLTARLADKYTGRLVARQLAEGDCVAWHSGDPPAAVTGTLHHADAADWSDRLFDHHYPLSTPGGHPTETQTPTPHVKFESVTLLQQHVLSKADIRVWLDKLPMSIDRIKGYVLTDGGALLVQKAPGATAQISPAQTRSGRLLLIGANPTFQQELKRLLTATTAWKIQSQ